MDVQWVIVAFAAGAAGVYALRRVLLQFLRPDDEPSGCQGCPANPTEPLRITLNGSDNAA
jgi:hypothetical protein